MDFIILNFLFSLSGCGLTEADAYKGNGSAVFYTPTNALGRIEVTISGGKLTLSLLWSLLQIIQTLIAKMVGLVTFFLMLALIITRPILQKGIAGMVHSKSLKTFAFKGVFNSLSFKNNSNIKITKK